MPKGSLQRRLVHPLGLPKCRVGTSLTAHPPRSPTRRSRISAAWVRVIIGLVVLPFVLASVIVNWLDQYQELDPLRLCRPEP